MFGALDPCSCAIGTGFKFWKFIDGAVNSSWLIIGLVSAGFTMTFMSVGVMGISISELEDKQFDKISLGRFWTSSFWGKEAAASSALVK